MMNDMNSDTGLLNSPRVATLASAFLAVAIALLAVQIIATLHNIDESPNAAQNVITVSGEGKASATPNLATISFTVSEDATTASAAQDVAAKKTNAALAVLKDQKIADKDIQTSSYNVSPRYSYPQPCVYNSSGMMPPCPAGGESKIIGYTASQTVTVKIRNLDSVGVTVSALGGAGISNLYGPNFTIENPDALQAKARAEAIADARTKANELARELGVRVVHVVNYSEGGGSYPGPYYKAETLSADSGPARPVPQIPTGENEVTVDVSVTYEIR